MNGFLSAVKRYLKGFAEISRVDSEYRGLRSLPVPEIRLLDSDYDETRSPLPQSWERLSSLTENLELAVNNWQYGRSESAMEHLGKATELLESVPLHKERLMTKPPLAQMQLYWFITKVCLAELIQLGNTQVSSEVDESFLNRSSNWWLEVIQGLIRGLMLGGDYDEVVKILEDVTSVTSKGKYQGALATSAPRDLALAYAFQGKFDSSDRKLQDAHANLARIAKRSNVEDQNARHEHEANALRYSVVFTEARIDFLAGNYQDALSKSTLAFEGLSRQYGPHHVKILEVAMYMAECLALKSKTVEAETVCRETMERMQTSLGPDHLFTLDAMRVLVLVLRTQGRFAEAVSEGKKSFGLGVIQTRFANYSTHPWPGILQGRCEYAASLRSAGEYAGAEGVLWNILDKRSLNLYRNKHGGKLGDKQGDKYDDHHNDTHRGNSTHILPTTLHYLSELAHCYISAGYFDAAEDLACATLRCEVDHLYRSQTEGHDLMGSPGEPVCAGMIKELLKDIKYEERLSEVMLHLQPILRIRRTEKGVTKVPQSDLGSLCEELLTLRNPELNNHTVEVELDQVDRRDIQSERLVIRTQVEQVIKDGFQNTDCAPGAVSERLYENTVQKKIYALYSRLRVHPHLLDTLQILARAKLRKETPEHDLGEEILKTVQEWKCAIWGSTHFSTLTAQHDLALAQMPFVAQQRLDSALDSLHKVWQTRAQTLNRWHPDIFSAERDYIVARFRQAKHHADLSTWPAYASSLVRFWRWTGESAVDSHGEEEFVNGRVNVSGKLAADAHDLADDSGREEVAKWWLDRARELRRVLAYQEDGLGKLHPECLKTMIWLIFVHINHEYACPIHDRQSEAVRLAEKALERLRDSKVRDQRVVEAASMAADIAGFFECQKREPEVLADFKEFQDHIRSDVEGDKKRVERIVKYLVQCMRVYDSDEVGSQDS